MSSGSEAPSNRRYPRITRSPGSLAYEFLDRFSERGGLLSGRKDALRGDDGGGERDRVVQHIVAGRPHGVRRVRFGRSGWNCRHGHHAVGGGDVCGYGMATPTTSATRVFIGPLSLLECATVGNDAASSLFDEKIDREVVGRQRLASSGSSGPGRSAVRAWRQLGPPLADERGHARDCRRSGAHRSHGVRRSLGGRRPHLDDHPRHCGRPCLAPGWAR